MAIRKYRQLPTQKLKGINIAPRPYDVIANPSRCFATLFRDWPWSTWIKPSVDACKAQGANYIRFFGGPASYYATLNFISQSTYLAQWHQLMAYCQSVGIMVHAIATFPPHLDGMTANSFAECSTAAALLAANLAPYPNLMAFEPMQEPFNGTSLGTTSAGNDSWSTNTMNAVVAAVMSASRAAAPDVPMACSVNRGNNTIAVWTAAEWTTFPAGDYLDAHIYYSASSADVATLMGQNSGKKLLLGEFGGPPFVSGAAAMASQLTACGGIYARSDCAGGAYWAHARMDSSTSNDYGIYDASDNTANATIGDVRTAIATAYSGLSGSPIPIRFRRKRRAI